HNPSGRMIFQRGTAYVVVVATPTFFVGAVTMTTILPVGDLPASWQRAGQERGLAAGRRDRGNRQLGGNAQQLAGTRSSCRERAAVGGDGGGGQGTGYGRVRTGDPGTAGGHPGGSAPGHGRGARRAHRRAGRPRGNPGRGQRRGPARPRGTPARPGG